MIFYLAMFTSFLTAFYMFRLYFSIFWHRPAHNHGHGEKEGNLALFLPLGLLALGSIGAGFIPFGNFVTSDGLPLASHFSVSFSVAPVLLGIAGIALAWWMYRRESGVPGNIAKTLGTFYEVVRNKFYIDELYQYVTKQILFPFVGRPAAWFDRNVVDGLVNLSGNATLSLSERIKGMQSGKVQAYALVFLAGLILLAIGLIYL